ncbi:DUF434 domain-containing protein [Marinobacter adhaerens]|uniref:DUF434 domain-containing protein n=1 Tax=Marinobacter adhaerens TaxID=1033846 RepID=A0A851HWM1_9GAMM|nr:DUF434 domain-containing protein [Marinobacter adhaerens]
MAVKEMALLLNRGYRWKASPQLLGNHFTKRYGQSPSPELHRAMEYPVWHWEKFVENTRYLCRHGGTGQKLTPDTHRKRFRFLLPRNLKITPYRSPDHAPITPTIPMPRGKRRPLPKSV